MRDSRLRRAATWAAALGLLMLVAAAWGLRQLTERRWEMMLAWAERTEAQWNERATIRPAIWGETGTGSAFDAYERALGIAQSLIDVDDQLLERVASSASPDEQEVVSIRARWGEALHWMSVGAHRDDVDFAVDWTDASFSVTTDLRAARGLADAARIEARARFAAGDERTAAELLLDTATLGSDLMRRPTIVEDMIGATLIDFALDRTLTDEVLVALDDSTLVLLRDALARLDACVDGTLRITPTEPLFLARLVEASELTSAFAAAGLSPALAWRYGFSERLMAASCVLELSEMYDELEAVEGRRWPDRRAVHQAWTQRIRDSANPLTLAAAVDHTSIETSKREIAARLRLLRMAVAWHLDGVVPELEDPLADAPLGAVRGMDAVTFTSAGSSPGAPIERRARPRS